MGTIKVRGNCKKEYEAEILNTMITLRVTSSNSGEAVNLGKSKMESILEAMEVRLGLRTECFALDREAVDRGYNSKEYTFTKSISIKTEISLKAAEEITDVLSSFSDVDYSFGYELKDIEQKEQNVLKQAIENSRGKAAAIAECIGQRITGAEDIRYEVPAETDEHERGICYSLAAGNGRSRRADKLSLPKITISKSVDITWITE